MKKKLMLLMCLVLVATSVTACGKKKTSTKKETTTETTTEEEEIVEEEYTNNDLLRAFIAGEEFAYFDRKNIEVYDEETEAYSNVFSSNTPYSLYDFVDKYLESEQINKDDSLTLVDITFCYFDCGYDSEKEVALKIDKNVYGSDEYTIFVFKTYDGKLELISQTDAGYRSEATLYEYGEIRYGGSNGAGSHYDEVSVITAEGETNFVYGLYTEYDGFNVPVSSAADVTSYDIIEDLELTDPFMVYMYDFKDYDEETEYNELVKHYYCQCFATDAEYEIVGAAILPNDGSKLAEYELRTGLNYYNDTELQAIVGGRMESCGLTVDIKEGRPVEWREMDMEPFAPIIAKINKTKLPMYIDEEDIANPILVNNPSWEYYNDGKHLDEATQRITLTEESFVDNDGGYDTDWFEHMGIDDPDSNFFDDDAYNYFAYGEDERYPDHLILEEKKTGAILATLDFSNYVYPDEYLKANEAYIKEYIHDAKVSDGLLYVSISHDIYQTSAAHNGYIVALDINDGFKVVWKSTPLTCNSNTFVIKGDTIICGYGCQNEKCRLYLVDKYTGKHYGSTILDTKATYLYLHDGKLQTREGDRDVTYEIADK